MRPIWNELIFWKKYLKENTSAQQIPPIYTWFFWIILILCVPYDFTVNSEGVLKAELDFLLGRYDQVFFQEANYQKYGLGATEVFIKQNVK